MSLRYYIAFHKETRKWQRVIVDATVNASDGSLRTPQTLIQVAIDPVEHSLPEPLRTTMQDLVDDAPQSDYVLHVPVKLTAVLGRWVIPDTGHPRWVEYVREQVTFSDELMLGFCRHLGCEAFEES